MSDIKEEPAIVSLLRNSEDVVISGIAGRFPESDSTDEFAENLLNNVDMITADDRRWPTDLYEMSHRMGKLKSIEKFDGSFFGYLGPVGDSIDPHSRILLETTHEAICDAGINPETLRGTNTGVYIGHSSMANCDGIPQEIQNDSLSSGMDVMSWIQGTAKTMYANRISFMFDFHGPSINIDTACSSSMVAFDAAVTDLRIGKIDTAIVGGTQIYLNAYANHTFQVLGMNAKDGISKIWDENADGYVRGETVSCLILQRKSVAKRIYATVVHSRSNIDGYKTSGIFFPSTEGQKTLLEKVYKEANVDPNDVNYFEAHGTGTKVGDAQEARAIALTYCEKRTKPLPIGLLKSNIGHGEGASGIASIVKVLISFENKCIPANLNLKILKEEIAKLSPLLLPVTKNLLYESGIAGVNSFGVGGVNGHALLKSCDKEITAESYRIVSEIPRLINVCGRTEEGLNYIFDFIEKNPKKVTREFLALLGDAMKSRKRRNLKSSGFPYRGSMIIKEVTRSDGSKEYEYTRQSSMMFDDKRQLWFFFSGMGSQWIGMGKSLMSVDIFAKSINKSAEILKEFNLNLLDIILDNDENALNTVTPAFVSITAIQIAMIDVFNTLNIHADGFIGHSFGENACAYADGCLNHEQTLLSSYWRGIETGKKSAAGIMASVGLSWNEAKRRVPKGVTVACNNSPKNVTISGTYKETTDFMETLKSENIFVREVNCYGLSYHSHHMNQFSENLLKRFKKIIPSPKERSCKWISSSVPESKWDNDDAKFASAEYFVNNLVNPVLFNSALIKHVPSDAIIVEIAPHALFGKLINQSLPDATYIGMIQKNKNDTNLLTFLSSIGKLYENGVNVAIEHFYPKVIWPVPKATQSIGSLIKWDHKESFNVRKYPDYQFHSTASDMIFNFNLTNPDHQYLTDHKIENRIVFPGSGYLMLAWMRLAAAKGKNWDKVPVVFENVQIQRPTLFSDNGTAKLAVRYIDGTGEFEILESGNVTCFGRIYSPQDECLQLQHLLDDENYDENNNEKNKFSQISTLESHDIYKEFHVRGHDYGPKFQAIVEMDFSDLKRLKSKVKWEQNWITFVDGMFQIPQMAFPFRSMLIPVCITSLRCDPKVFFEAIDEYKIIDTIEEPENEIKTMMGNVPGVTDSDKQENSDAIESFNENFPELKTMLAEKKKVSIVPAVFDLHRFSIIAKGIEVRNIMPALMPRRPLTHGIRLERHEFIPHHETDAIEGCLKLEINQYIDVCGALALKSLRLFEINAKSIVNDTIEVDYEPIKCPKEEHLYFNVFSMMNENFKKCQNRNENITHMIKEFMEKENMDPSKDFLNNICINQRLIRPMIDIVNENNTKRELKVLEINVNDQIMAKEIEEILSLTFVTPVNVEYTITTKNVSQYNDDVNMKRFKFVEYDHKTLFPNDITSLDLIIHRDSIDIWDLDLHSYLQSVHASLKNNGFLLTLFRSKITSPELVFHYLYENKHLKDINMNHRIAEFEKISKSLGFEVINRKSDSILYNAILFRKINKNIDPQKQTIVNLDICKYNVWLETLKDKVKEHKEKNENENIWIIANDSPINGILGLITCLRQEPGGDRIRCIFDPQSKLPSPIDFSQKIFYDLLIYDLAFNVFRNDKFGTFRHLSFPKNYDKIETRESHLNVSQRGDLSSLQWFDSTHIKLPKELINNGKVMEMVRCHVYYAALNFKDVMIASGRIMSGPEAEFLDCLIGLEFAGRRCDNRQRVYGLSIGGAIATSLVTNSRIIFEIPDEWTMEDASTIFSVYFTVWYGLINRGAMRKGESVLIHSGAGGIGQSAIMVCQYYNCNIFTTVGTEEKRNFLKEKYNIPDDHIFSSRDTAFEEKLFSATNGRGVDIVLNSLTDDKFQASFRCLNYDGRFIELGKFDFQMNHKLNTLLFLKNISFHGVGVDRVLTWGFENEKFIETIGMFSQWIDDGVKLGYVKPINRTVYPMNKAEDAFRYMLTGKHTGKLVIKIRDEESDKNIINPEPVNVIATTKTWFDPEKVYIIIGGLGGMGLELLHWIKQKGAKNIVLSSRSGIKTNYQRLILKRFDEFFKETEMKNFAANICISTSNVMTVEGSNQLIETAESMGPIGGVFQLAVVLNDGLFTDQTVESFDETCEPKVNATINLDKVTRQRCPQLDYFVVFSSVSCGRGNAGQTNYGYANSVMERICEQRRNDGIHGLAIQWGPIGDVGVVSDEYDEKIKMAGLVKQRINVCMHVLEKFLQCPYPIISSMIKAERQITGSSMEENMMNNLWLSLGVDPKITPNHLTLGELGMESFVAVELQQRMEREYEITLSISDIKRITVGDLKEFQSGNKEKVKAIAMEIKKSRAELSKIKFIIPFEYVTKLNDISKGKPLYFMPPIEGIFDKFKDFTKLLKRPVYGLNWTRETNSLKDIKQIALYYMKILKDLEPKGEYDLLGYSFGAVVAIKMLFKRAPIDNLIIIDTFSSTQLSDDLIDDEYFELFLKSSNNNIPESYRLKMKKEILSIKDENERIKKVIYEFKDFGEKSIIGKDFDDIIKGSFSRGKLLIDFKRKMIDKTKNKMKMKIVKSVNKFMGIHNKVNVIKIAEDANDVKSIQNDITETYGISPEDLENKYNLEIIIGNPVDNENFEIISESLNILL